MTGKIMTKDQHMAAHGQAQSKCTEWLSAQLSVSPMSRAKIKADAVELMVLITDALHAEHGCCIDVINEQCETVWATIAVYMAERAAKAPTP